MPADGFSDPHLYRALFHPVAHHRASGRVFSLAQRLDVDGFDTRVTPAHGSFHDCSAEGFRTGREQCAWSTKIYDVVFSDLSDGFLTPMALRAFDLLGGDEPAVHRAAKRSESGN